MNCKQGDIAIVVLSFAGNEGKIVRCMRPLIMKWKRYDGSTYMSESWEIDIALPDRYGVLSKYTQDRQLRPIRDPGNDATDETLTWLPVPTKETA